MQQGHDARKRLWSVDGDIQSLAEVIRRWLEENGRIGSRKFLVGESYGGFRAPSLARWRPIMASGWPASCWCRRRSRLTANARS
jgi:hypothetical protein